MPTRTDVQTDVHIVPVDSESPTRKLATTLIYQCKWCSYLAQTYTPAAPFPLSSLMHHYQWKCTDTASLSEGDSLSVHVGVSQFVSQ